MIPYLEVEKQRRAGFRTSSLEVLLQVHDPELDDDDVRAPCHQCGFGAGHQSTGPPLFQCERCSRWWHAHCLPGSPLPALIEAVPVWTCPSCRPATPHCPAPLQLCRVQWVPEWQGEKHIRSLKGGPDALNRFLARPPPHPQLPELHASPPTHQHHPELHATLRPNTPPARKVAGSRRRAPTRPPRSPPPPEPTPLSAVTNIVLDEADPDRDAAPTGHLSLMTAPPASSLNPGPTPLYSLHYPDGRIVSPKLLSPERLDWLHTQFITHSNKPIDQFLPSLTALLERYHPRASTINPQGRSLDLRNHWAVPRPLMRAIQSSLDTSTELYASPLNCNMATSNTYFSAFPEDSDFGAIHDCHSYRWTGSCIANPEYIAEDMRKAVRHALESATYDPPFLCLFILPRWDDTPWRSADIMAHEHIEILASLPNHQMRFAPANVDPTNPLPPLPPARWPVDFVIVANTAGRTNWLNIHKLQTIFTPALRHLCAVPDQHIELFPEPPHSPLDSLASPTSRPPPYTTHLRRPHLPSNPPMPMDLHTGRITPRFWPVDNAPPPLDRST